MSAQDFDIYAIVIPDPEIDHTTEAQLVNGSYGLQLQAGDAIQTLSSTNPNGYGIIQGLLYVPDVIGPDNGCDNSTLSLIPSNVTRRNDLPDNYPIFAIAPWTDAACVQTYFANMRMDAVRGAIFYHNDNGSSQPPPSSDPSWSLQDGGRWKQENQFPVYGIPGTLGTFMLNELAKYSGNMSSASYGNKLVKLYDPRDSVRLFARIDVSTSQSIPSLWVFLIIVLAILLAIVLSTSFIMHMVQRRRRRVLARRVANGEVDLEALGIKRLNVPQSLLDKMPQYTYTSKEGTALEASSNRPKIREVPFTQSTCPICLDDFIHGETTVRELPCQHIFHAECIDPFLRDNSSLCPMCKKSALPSGYCPVTVTNIMVRRERLIQRVRQRDQTPAREQPVSRLPVVGAMQRRVRRLSGTQLPPAAHTRPAGDASEMQNISLTSSRRSRAPDLETNFEELPADRREVVGEVPAEVEAQGASARRAWLRDRLARREREEYDQHAQEVRAVVENRPLWRRFAGRIFPNLE